jgi:hypothetical protein
VFFVDLVRDLGDFWRVFRIGLKRLKTAKLCPESAPFFKDLWQNLARKNSAKSLAESG